MIKVCGMHDPDNIRDVAQLGIDLMGFIFYPRSPRFFSGDPAGIAAATCAKVGVFVNATTEEMRETAIRYQLDYLQLHGQETPEQCHTLQKRGYALIKALSIATVEDVKRAMEYADRVEYLLFDTKCAGYGGSGRQFDWSLLTHYTGDTPFLLSGGIGPDSLVALRQFTHPRWAGIDLNSAFESAPGHKEVERLRTFINQYKKEIES
ncbi:MAG: phosphoribosylanthranilate isomerase [Parabacteroides sp.]